MTIEEGLKIASLMFLLGGFIPLFVVNNSRDKKKKLKYWKKTKAIVYDFDVKMIGSDQWQNQPAYFAKYKGVES